MEIQFFKYIHLAFSSIFFGFAFFSLLLRILQLLSKSVSKTFVESFQNYATKIVVVTGIFAFVFYAVFLGLAMSGIPNDIYGEINQERFHGAYALSYRYLIFRPLVMAGIAICFCFHWLKRHVIIKNIALLFLLFISLFSGVFLEKSIIFMTSIHRDYLPSSHTTASTWSMVLYEEIIFRLLFFLFIVIVYWQVKERLLTKNNSSL